MSYSLATIHDTFIKIMTPTVKRPLIGLMLGDPTGIGPEVALKLLARPETHAQAKILIVGDVRVFESTVQELGIALKPFLVESAADIDWQRLKANEIAFIDLANMDPNQVKRGVFDASIGWQVGKTLHELTALALKGEIDAVCFAPLHKAAINRGGWKYLDEHAMFAAWNEHKGYYGEVNIIPQFCTFRVTSHVSLRQVVDLVTPERIRGAIKLAHTVLNGLGHDKPRIGVAALNPHAGESGLFGDEEITIIRPTIESLNHEGFQTEGPYPSDTVFLKAKGGLLDAVVIMYHDQGQIATKLLGFSEGVTLTGGLKTIYTTPAHGTAYDIVGQNKANPGAMIKAFEVAVRLANQRQSVTA